MFVKKFLNKESEAIITFGRNSLRLSYRNILIFFSTNVEGTKSEDVTWIIFAQ